MFRFLLIVLANLATNPNTPIIVSIYLPPNDQSPNFDDKDIIIARASGKDQSLHSAREWRTTMFW